MIKRLVLILIPLLIFPAATNARVVDSCVSFDDPIKMGILQKELNGSEMPFRVDGKLVCVPSEYRDAFYGLVSKLFPPVTGSSEIVTIPKAPDGSSLNSMKLSDASQQMLLITELKKRGIWFVTDEDGAIWYKTTRGKEVDKLSLDIFEADIPVGRSIGYPKEAYANIFASLLEENGVRFERKYRHDTYYVVWDAKDASKVEPLMNLAKEKIIDLLKKMKREK